MSIKKNGLLEKIVFSNGYYCRNRLNKKNIETLCCNTFTHRFLSCKIIVFFYNYVIR